MEKKLSAFRRVRNMFETEQQCFFNVSEAFSNYEKKDLHQTREIFSATE